MTDLAQRGERREERRRGSRSAPPAGGIAAPYLRVAVVPAAAVAVLSALTITFLLASDHSAASTGVALTAAAVLTALVLLAAAAAASDAARQLHRQVSALRAASSRGTDELALVAERAQRGDSAGVAPLPPQPPDGAEPLLLLGCDLQRERHAAQQAVLAATAAQAARAADAGQRVEVFVNLARRMQSLVHREIQLLDDLEAQVEDPVLLKGLFTVDHLATRMRRQSESLAVLGGAVSRRQWSRSVSMHEVLRAAVAEVEQYSRVKVVPPIEGMLAGSAVADIIHLVAELAENATKFSAPHTQALLRAQTVTAGLVIEVEDRGLGMLAADQQRLNELLADPATVSVGELLRDGRIGLLVVATLARRHGIRVQLRSNIYGGIQAVVVLPKALVERPAGRGRQDAGPEATVPVPALPARHAPAPTPAPAAASVWTGMAAEGRYAPASRPPWDTAPSPAIPRARPAGPAAPGPAAPAAPPAAHAPSAGERPELPRRGTGQAHMAPELRVQRPPRLPEPPQDDQLPGLMAAFQEGISRAAAHDSNPPATDSPR